VRRPPVTDAVVAAAPSGEIVFWGRGAQQTFGYSATEIVGKPLSTIVKLPRLRNGGTFRVDATRKSGESFRAGVVVEPWSRDGDALMSVVIRDESRWSLFADFVDIVSQYTSFAAAAPRVAEAIGRALGFDAVAMWIADEPKPRRTVWWSADGAPMRESGLVERVRRGGERMVNEEAMAIPVLDRATVVYVIELFCADGEFSAAVTDELARIAASAGHFVSRERMSVALRVSEERYRRLFNESVAAVCAASPRGVITAANPTFTQMFGLDDAHEVRLETLLADRAEWKRIAREVERRHPVAHREVQGLRTDQTPFWMLLSVTPLVDGRDSLLITAIDIDAAHTFAEAHELSIGGVFELGEGNVVRASDGLYRMFGIVPQSRPLTLRHFQTANQLLLADMPRGDSRGIGNFFR